MTDETQPDAATPDAAPAEEAPTYPLGSPEDLAARSAKPDGELSDDFILYLFRDAWSPWLVHILTVDGIEGAEDRLAGFAVVNPALPGAAAEVERCVGLGLRGLKLVPAGWYPYDDAPRAVYAAAEAHRLPVLFHSGIFIDGRSSRYCRPAYYEALRDSPTLRATLAHLGWPWCDEAIAVALIDRIHGLRPNDCQFRLDISFGPPPPYRQEVIGRAWQVLGAELLLYGSDRFLPCTGADLRRAQSEAAAVLDRLGLSDAEARRVFSENARDWLHARPT